MRFSDYAHADCKLFEIPCVDIGLYQEQIMDLIMTAWQQESSPEYAIDVILKGDVAKAIMEKVAPHLNHQRRRELGQAIEYQNCEIERTDEDKRQRLQEIEAAFDERRKQLGYIKDESAANLEQKTAAYSASQARIKELHDKIEAGLKGLGGKRGIEMLKRAADAATGGKPIAVELPTYDTLEQKATETKQGGLEAKTADDAESKKPDKKHKGPFYAIYTITKNTFSKLLDYFRK